VGNQGVKYGVGAEKLSRARNQREHWKRVFDNVIDI